MGGVPAFAARWEDVTPEASSYLQWAEAMERVQEEAARRAAFMREIDPFERIQGFCPKPLLMIQGDLDTDSPIKYAVDLYRSLKPLYRGHPERLRLSIRNGVGHEFAAGMREEVCAWFGRYLFKDRRRACRASASRV